MSAQSSDWIRAARAVRRCGFGARGVEIDAAIQMGGPSVYVPELVPRNLSNDAGYVESLMPDISLPDHPGPSANERTRQRFQAKLSEQVGHLTRWWVQRMVSSDEPALEKLTFLWHNHFATSAKKVKNSYLLGRQNAKIRRYCLGDFGDLAYAMLTDAAMIVWLDGRENVAEAPNENLSREFLELFALGHGKAYTESDVREGARALTGWTVRKDGSTAVVDGRHDYEQKSLLDSRGDFDTKAFCEIILSSPSSAEHVASRLWGQLASDSPPSRRTLDRLIQAYGPRRDLRALAIAILSDQTFLNGETTIVSSPVDWVIGVFRAFGVEVDNEKWPTLAISALKNLGQLPFFPPDVGGWPCGQAWLTTSAVTERLSVAKETASNGDISRVAEAPVTDRIDAVGYLIGVGAWSDRTVRALKPLRKNPPALAAAAVNTPEYLTT